MFYYSGCREHRIELILLFDIYIKFPPHGRSFQCIRPSFASRFNDKRDNVNIRMNQEVSFKYIIYLRGRLRSPIYDIDDVLMVKYIRLIVCSGQLLECESNSCYYAHTDDEYVHFWIHQKNYNAFHYFAVSIYIDETYIIWSSFCIGLVYETL